MFQHSTTEIYNNEIIFFGRQENGKSVAVRIQGYQPHAIIRCSAPLDTVSSVLKQAVSENYIWRRNTQHNEHLNLGSFHDGICVKETKGRSITSAEKEETFFKITANNIDIFTCLEHVLQKRYSNIYKQYHDGSYVSRRKSLTLFVERFDRVSLLTQYCVVNDIATCTTLTWTGTEAKQKITTCDKENHQRSLKPIVRTPFRWQKTCRKGLSIAF